MSKVEDSKVEKKEEEKVEREQDKKEEIPASKAEDKKEKKSEEKDKKKKVEPKKEEVKKEGEPKVEEVAEIKKKQSPEVSGIIEAVEKMTVMELSNLVSALEDKFGVVAAAPMAMGAAPATAAAEAAQEKTDWDVVLVAAGEKKIQVIKEVRAVTSLGLKEAKALVEEAPKPVKEGLPKKEAEEVKTKLEAVGATVELK